MQAAARREAEARRRPSGAGKPAGRDRGGLLSYAVGFKLLLNNNFLLLLQLPQFRVEICKIWADFLQILQISEIFADF